LRVRENQINPLDISVDFDEVFSQNHSQWTNMDKLQQTTCHKLHKE